MAKIERCCAPGVFDPPAHSQSAEVTGAQTILFLAGQVAGGGGTMASIVEGPAFTLVAIAVV